MENEARSTETGLPDGVTRREFVKRSTTLAAGASFGILSACERRPAAGRKADAEPTIVGEGEHRYAVDHHWAKLPQGMAFGYTHGIVEDRAGRIYVANQGPQAIMIFDPEGNFISAWGETYSAGAHGLNITVEDGEEVLYLANTNLAEVVKTTLDGEVIWKRGTPDRPDIYGEDETYSPTETAIAPDGTVYVADGYGQHWVHIYTRDGTYLDSFGGPGDGEDNFSTPHGINIDDRGGEPVVQVADRGHVRIANFSLEGAFIETIVAEEDLRYPCATIHADGKMYVPDLFARLSIFDMHHDKIVDLGDYVDGGTLTSWDDFGTEYPELEGYPNLPHEKRLPGKFSSPHDLWVDGEGNIYVVEWIEDGRVTKMTKV